MASAVIAKVVPVAAGLMYAEAVLIPTHFPEVSAWLTSTSSILPSFSVPKAFGFVILINFIISGFLVLSLGMKVGASRKNFIAKAIKDGEKNAEVRYALPNMYVDGHTENARLFNCLQRGHQQALETYSQFLVFSVLGGMRFPLFTTCSGLLWVYARGKWAEGYSSGKPENRYSHWAGHGIWYGLIGCFLASVGTTLGVFGIV